MSTAKRSRRDDDDGRDGSEEEDFPIDRGGHKSKKAKPSKSSLKSGSPSSTTEEYWTLSSSARTPRRANISVFKNSRLVNIREFYDNGQGEFLPGKKGISLTIDQYKNLLKAIPKINSKLRDMGEDIDDQEDSIDEDDNNNNNNEGRSSGKVKSKSDRSNIDATSDEDED